MGMLSGMGWPLPLGGRGTVFMSVYNLGAGSFVLDLLMDQHSLPVMVLNCHFVQGTASSLPAYGR